MGLIDPSIDFAIAPKLEPRKRSLDDMQDNLFRYFQTEQ